MKRILTILVCITGVAQAAPVPLTAIVKVRSGLCGMSEVRYAGSGLAFRDGPRAFVLTSEHVLLHGNGSFCHSVATDEGLTAQARVHTTDYARGIALLELSTPPDHWEMASLTGFSEVEVRERNEPVLVAGFPH